MDYANDVSTVSTLLTKGIVLGPIVFKIRLKNVYSVRMDIISIVKTMGYVSLSTVKICHQIIYVIHVWKDIICLSPKFANPKNVEHSTKATNANNVKKDIK